MHDVREAAARVLGARIASRAPGDVDEAAPQRDASASGPAPSAAPLGLDSGGARLSEATIGRHAHAIDVERLRAVRVHHDADWLRGLGARAASVGTHVVLDEAHGRMETHLSFAHELAHVALHAHDTTAIHRDVDPDYRIRLRSMTDPRLIEERDAIDARFAALAPGAPERADLEERRAMLDAVVRERGGTLSPHGRSVFAPPTPYEVGETVTVLGHTWPVARNAVRGEHRGMLDRPLSPREGVHLDDVLRVPLADGSHYIVAANTSDHESDAREVVVFVAYHTGRSRVEWTLGPDVVHDLVSAPDEFAARAERRRNRVELLAAPLAFRGERLYDAVETLPPSTNVPTDYVIHRDPFIIAPNCVYDANGIPYVAFYIAYHTGLRLNTHVVGPDSIDAFLSGIQARSAQAGMAYMWGPPPRHLAATWRAQYSLMEGDVGGMFSNIGSAWSEAVRDPGWWLQMVTSVAGSVAGPRTPPSLSVVRGGGGGALAVSTSAATRVAPAVSVPLPRVVGNVALAEAPAVAMAAPARAPLVGLPTNPMPTPISPVPAWQAATATALTTIATHSTSPSTGPATATAPGTGPTTPTTPLFTLILPPQKARHATLYRELIAERRLVSELPYVRGNPAQATKWDRMLRPENSGTGMSWDVYQRGERSLHPATHTPLTRREILRPTWSRTSPSMPMDVDHVVELQVTPRSERDIWNSAVNYELLDESSNASSGPQLEANIQAERARLAALTGNTAYLTMTPLPFQALVVQPGPPGQRWLEDEIRVGEHLDELDER